MNERNKGGMISLFEHGWNSADIAELYGVSEALVCQVLHQWRWK